MAKTKVIYHGGCLDGFGAAYAVWKAIPDAEFYPGTYQKPPPDVEGYNVYLVDFSYKRSVVEKMLESAASVTIIDHHDSAIKDLEGLVHPNLHKFFTSANSGAVKTWEVLHPSKPTPLILTLIEDRDLWKFKYPNTKPVTAALYFREFSFEAWDTYCTDGCADSIVALTTEGSILLQVEAKHVRAVIDRGGRMAKYGPSDDPIWAPTYNCGPEIKSEVGNQVLLDQPDVPFSVTYYDTDTDRVFSLRSRKGGLNLTSLAEYYGGGGHPQASGFTVPLAALDIIGLL